MYQKSIAFAKSQLPADLLVSAADLYTEEKGYGFVIEKNRREQERLQLPELNSAFCVWYWDNSKNLSTLVDTANGITITASELCTYKEGLPLSFKLKTPHAGCYQISLTVSCEEKACENLIIFTGRRHLAARNIFIKAGDCYQATFTIHICDFIPRGKEEVYEDTTLDLTLLGENISLSYLSVREIEIPVIYIAGDSTVTDQSGCYPYDPGCCYSGWGQMLSAFAKPGIAISNHAHSGLTTESFRSEGHYAIVKHFIQRGDYYLIQFAHNDQKCSELDAAGGYRKRLITYIEEIRACGAVPILVTPLARNTWKGDGTYNDLLVDYAAECIRIGTEYQVPVIDLHEYSMNFVKQEGLDQAKRYFYPKDYTHTNDYGAYRMAGFIASRLAELEGLNTFFDNSAAQPWTPPQKISLPLPPEGYETEHISALPSIEKLERPKDVIVRVELLNDLVKTVGYVPVNVYNDMYPDVTGHEWYAGVVEVSYQNSLVDPKYTADGSFHPLAPVTWEQLISFCINGYKSRKATALKEDPIHLAKQLGIIKETYQPEKAVTRREALCALLALEKAL